MKRSLTPPYQEALSSSGYDYMALKHIVLELEKKTRLIMLYQLIYMIL